MQDVSGSLALVTGAANGIGLGICWALGRADVHAAPADIQPDALERARGRVNERHARMMAGSAAARYVGAR